MKIMQINASGLTGRVVEASLDSLDKELRPFALRISPILAYKVVPPFGAHLHRQGSISALEKFPRRVCGVPKTATSQPDKTILEIEL